MPLTSDITLNSGLFAQSAITTKANDFNKQLMDMMQSGPKWYEVGAAKYREMRANGETPLPALVLDPRGRASSIPSRDGGREIPTRIFEPVSGPPKAVYMHIHGGGWVLQDERSQDGFLKAICDNSQVTIVSIGYRLAPEYPYPAGPNDCFDAAEWLIDNALEHYGAEMKFIGGESAGGHLSSLVVFHLLDTRPNFYFRGVVLSYGAFNLSGFSPSVTQFDKPLVLTADIMDKYMEAFLPNTTVTDRRHPAISPYFNNLFKLAAKSKDGKLPPALFMCGTEDPLLDDTVMFGTKWSMSGSESVVKIYPGAPHGFNIFSPSVSESASASIEAVKIFLDERMA